MSGRWSFWFVFLMGRAEDGPFDVSVRRMNDGPDRNVAALDEAANWYILLREAPKDAELRARFTQWLEAKPDNARAWSAMGYTVAAIERTPPELQAQLRGLLAPARASRWLRGRAHRPSLASAPRNKGRIALAAAVAACLAVVAAPSLWLQVTADTLTGTGEVKTVRLPDGSKAVLGPDSAIRFHFADGRRDVELLSGQAFFEVRPDPAHPFAVEARGVRTTVLGTVFDVRLLGERTRVDVNHGRVRIQSKAERIELTADGWAQVDGDAALTSGQQASDLAGVWQTGKAFVRNRTISEVIDEIRPWQSGRILLLDKRLGAQKVTGIYDVTDPANALALLINPYGGRVIQLSPWLLIVTH